MSPGRLPCPGGGQVAPACARSGSASCPAEPNPGDFGSNNPRAAPVPLPGLRYTGAGFLRWRYTLERSERQTTFGPARPSRCTIPRPRPLRPAGADGNSSVIPAAARPQTAVRGAGGVGRAIYSDRRMDDALRTRLAGCWGSPMPASPKCLCVAERREVSADCGSSWPSCHRALATRAVPPPDPDPAPSPARVGNPGRRKAGVVGKGCREAGTPPLPRGQSFWICPLPQGRAGGTRGHLHPSPCAGDGLWPGREGHLAWSRGSESCGSLPGPAPRGAMDN